MTIPTKLKEKYPHKSEFGEGFLICLIKFAEHAEDLTRYREVCKKIERTSEHANAMWFYGASDHLYGLECPKRFKGTRIEELVKKLQRYLHEKRLAFTLSEDDVITIMDLVREIAILVDKELGVKADIGEW